MKKLTILIILLLLLNEITITYCYSKKYFIDELTEPQKEFLKKKYYNDNISVGLAFLGFGMKARLSSEGKDDTIHNLLGYSFFPICGCGYLLYAHNNKSRSIYYSENNRKYVKYRSNTQRIFGGLFICALALLPSLAMDSSYDDFYSYVLCPCGMGLMFFSGIKMIFNGFSVMPAKDKQSSINLFPVISKDYYGLALTKRF